MTSVKLAILLMGVVNCAKECLNEGESPYIVSEILNNPSLIIPLSKCNNASCLQVQEEEVFEEAILAIQTKYTFIYGSNLLMFDIDPLNNLSYNSNQRLKARMVSLGMIEDASNIPSNITVEWYQIPLYNANSLDRLLNELDGNASNVLTTYYTENEPSILVDARDRVDQILSRKKRYAGLGPIPEPLHNDGQYRSVGRSKGGCIIRNNFGTCVSAALQYVNERGGLRFITDPLRIEIQRIRTEERNRNRREQTASRALMRSINDTIARNALTTDTLKMQQVEIERNTAVVLSLGAAIDSSRNRTNERFTDTAATIRVILESLDSTSMEKGYKEAMTVLDALAGSLSNSEHSMRILALADVYATKKQENWLCTDIPTTTLCSGTARTVRFQNELFSTPFNPCNWNNKTCSLRVTTGVFNSEYYGRYWVFSRTNTGGIVQATVSNPIIPGNSPSIVCETTDPITHNGVFEDFIKTSRSYCCFPQKCIVSQSCMRMTVMSQFVSNPNGKNMAMFVDENNNRLLGIGMNESSNVTAITEGIRAGIIVPNNLTVFLLLEDLDTRTREDLMTLMTVYEENQAELDAVLGTRVGGIMERLEALDTRYIENQLLYNQRRSETLSTPLVAWSAVLTIMGITQMIGLIFLFVVRRNVSKLTL